jgi:hypothetical protein
MVEMGHYTAVLLTKVVTVIHNWVQTPRAPCAMSAERGSYNM